LPESPEYTAVTVCVPTVRVEVLPEVAVPPESVTGEPKLVPSTRTAPCPSGVAVTVAVKLTLVPYVDGLRLEETAVSYRL